MVTRANEIHAYLSLVILQRCVMFLQSTIVYGVAASVFMSLTGTIISRLISFGSGIDSLNERQYTLVHAYLKCSVVMPSATLPLPNSGQRTSSLYDEMCWPDGVESGDWNFSWLRSPHKTLRRMR